MPWILLFITLLCAPLQAATIPGITAPAASSASSTQNSEPSVEQKKQPMRRWQTCWKTMIHAKN